MSNLFVLPPEDYATCPYDPTHRILWRRMPLHLMKCHNQHELDPLQSCPFDTKHMVPEQEMQFHMLMCEAKVIIESDITSRQMQPKTLQDESKGCQQVPHDSSVLRSSERNLSNGRRVRKRFPKLKTDQMVGKIETLSEKDKEMTWDEDVHQSGVVIRPFTFGESAFRPDLKDCRSVFLRDNVIPLRKPLNVVQISESRQARNPLVYNYAMNSVGIGRGAGRGKTMTVRESCSDVNLSMSHIGSLGVGRAQSRIPH